MNDSNGDRRKDQRHEARIKIRFATPEAFEKEYAANLSKGGLFVNTRKQRPLRSHIKFNIILPVTNESIELTGEVVHVLEARPGMDPSSAGVGVQFIDFTPEKRLKIEKYISGVDGQGEYAPPEEGEEEEAPREKEIKSQEYLKEALRKASMEKSELGQKELVGIKRKIRLFYAKRAERNYYDLLGVGYAAQPSSIRKAYHKCSMEFFPDKQPKGLPGDLKEKIEDIFGRINRAYKVLKDIDSRLEYDVSVGNWRSVEGVPELSEEAKHAHHVQAQYAMQYPEKVERAEALLGEAQDLHLRGDKKGARLMVKFAHTFNPFNPRILSLMEQLGVNLKPSKRKVDGQ